MNKTVDQNLTISELLNLPNSIQLLTDEIAFIRAEIDDLKKSNNDDWMPIDQAAKSLGKSVSAVRQRLKHPKKPLPHGKVWKQDAKGCAIKVHLSNYRRLM